jgi:basic membrane protein A
MLKRNALFVLIIALSLVLVVAPTAAQDGIRVALVLPGSIADRGFNQSAYDGLLLLESELGAEIAFSEMTPVANYERAYRDFADEEFEVVIGHGFEFAEVTVEVAPDYPDVFFVVTNHPGVDDPPENVAFIQPLSKDSAFLAGVAAGLATESNVVGAVAGFDFPTIVAQIEAFEIGMRSVNPDAELREVYIGTFDDANVGKEAAEALIAEGADVIYQIADSAGLGAIQAAEEAGAWAIGWGLDQQDIAPGTMLTTQIVNTGLMMMAEIELIQNGEFEPGSAFFGLSTGVVGYAPLDSSVEDWTPFMDSLAAAVDAGIISVPFLPEAGLAEAVNGGWLSTP